jgi:hypothetical protein
MTRYQLSVTSRFIFIPLRRLAPAFRIMLPSRQSSSRKVKLNLDSRFFSSGTSDGNLDTENRFPASALDLDPDWRFFHLVVFSSFHLSTSDQRLDLPPFSLFTSTPLFPLC